MIAGALAGFVARLRGAAAARRARWESHCLQCGLCCYEKEVRGDGVVTSWRRPCVYLDTRTKLCSVYERRFEACPSCRRMTLRHALFVTWLPEDCGYVRRYRRPRRPPTRDGRAAPAGSGAGRE